MEEYLIWHTRTQDLVLCFLGIISMIASYWWKDSASFERKIHCSKVGKAYFDKAYPDEIDNYEYYSQFPRWSWAKWFRSRDQDIIFGTLVSVGLILSLPEAWDYFSGKEFNMLFSFIIGLFGLKLYSAVLSEIPNLISEKIKDLIKNAKKN